MTGKGSLTELFPGPAHPAGRARQSQSLRLGLWFNQLSVSAIIAGGYGSTT